MCPAKLEDGRRENIMFAYKRKVYYYETDRMGIVHHSNYVRWLEEARMGFLSHVGAPYAAAEDAGIISPVVGIEVEYKQPFTFDEELEISVGIEKYNGVRLDLCYAVRKAGSQAIMTSGRTKHCFMKNGAVCSLRHSLPWMHDALMKAAAEYAPDNL